MYERFQIEAIIKWTERMSSNVLISRARCTDFLCFFVTCLQIIKTSKYPRNGIVINVAIIEDKNTLNPSPPFSPSP